MCLLCGTLSGLVAHGTLNPLTAQVSEEQVSDGDSLEMIKVNQHRGWRGHLKHLTLKRKKIHLAATFEPSQLLRKEVWDRAARASAEIDSLHDPCPYFSRCVQFVFFHSSPGCGSNGPPRSDKLSALQTLPLLFTHHPSSSSSSCVN